MGRLRKGLHWLGVENEHGLFSWRLALLVVGWAAVLTDPSVYTGLAALGGLIVHLWEGARSQERTRIAMTTANEQARERMHREADLARAVMEHERADKLADMKAEIDGARKQLAELQERVKLIATPEQIEKLQAYFKQRMGVGIGGIPR